MKKKLLAILIIGLVLTGCSNVKGPQAKVETTQISGEDALDVAITHAGVGMDKITSQSVNLIEGKPSYYGIHFETDTDFYDYKVSLTDGKILLSSTNDTSNTTLGTGLISEDEAKRIVFEHAAVKEEDVTMHRISQDYEDGRRVYEIEFYVGTQEFDYDIDMETGEVVQFSQDIKGYTPQASKEDIGIAKAKEIALAKVDGANDNHIYIKKDYDDGRLVYEGEIIYDGMEYEFEIDGSNGTVIEWDAEPIN